MRTHIVVCRDIAYPTINGVSSISAKGCFRSDSIWKGGWGALTPKIFALQISEVVIINCKALAIQ